ncbi:MAG: hypothetical protein FJ106_05160 [Deltaproteobacteria bacterium]|nr:hypothetical protein [Deltaproteobacteria bacterium]
MKKLFNSEKYGMIICPICTGNGYIQNPERQCCPKCGGFGFIRKGERQGVERSLLSESYYTIGR